MRAIFFDLDGTLVALPDDFAELFEAALADHGVRADAERREHFTEAFFDYLDECRADPYRAAMADLRAEHALTPSAEALAESYAEREAAATTLRPDAREALDALAAAESDDSAADVALGVLTNGGARGQRRKVAVHDLADHFEAVVVSAEVGAGKPDPGIFEAAQNAIPADEYAFVADDLDRDVRPAQREGFTGVYVTGDGEADSSASQEAQAKGSERSERPDHRVESLREVPGLFE